MASYDDYTAILRSNEDNWMAEIDGSSMDELKITIQSATAAISIATEMIKAKGSIMDEIISKLACVTDFANIALIKSFSDQLVAVRTEIKRFETDISLINRGILRAIQRMETLSTLISLTPTETSNAESTADFCDCKPACTECTRRGQGKLDFCMNDCVSCKQERKYRRKLRNQNIEHKVRLEFGPIPGVTLENNGYIGTNDKYFFVTLIADKQDGSSEYLKERIVKNFRSMFPPSFPAKAACYVLEDKINNLTLYGLIRYDHRGKYKICPTSSHLKNEFINMYTRQRVRRHLNVENLTIRDVGKFSTFISAVKTRYELMQQIGIIIGSDLDQMLVPG
jgi:hypothetical protein